MPLNFLGFVYRGRSSSRSSTWRRCSSWCGVEREIDDGPNAKPLAVAHGEVAFDGVSFAYDVRRLILKDVSFSVPPGRTLAIVGASGAGKSTVSRLLFRFYDVDSGAIRIDGQDLRDGKTRQPAHRHRHRSPGYRPVQRYHRLQHPLRAPRCRAARGRGGGAPRPHRCLHRRLADGYETMVGERGLKLSGGEKQRVAIARPFSRTRESWSSTRPPRPSIRTPRRRSRRRCARSRKAVPRWSSPTVVDHRGCRGDYRARRGRVIERGTHELLLARDGHYAAMWAKQQRPRCTSRWLEEALRQASDRR